MVNLVTGAAGFIGFHTCNHLLKKGEIVIGIDNINSYYSRKLKLARLEILNSFNSLENQNFKFIKSSIEDQETTLDIFQKYNPINVIHLAAQAGVRYSIENPNAYIQSNLVGFGNILEACRKYPIKHLIYASSSSVYGGNERIPFHENHGVDHPISLYAATKKANELMAHSYSHLYNLSTTGLRFFTVYGPWGRPDMALFLFTKAILNYESIKVFNNGNMQRDFTYIDDVVESIYRLIKKPPKANNFFDKSKIDPSISWAPYKVFNIGNSNSVSLLSYIEAIEESLKIKAIKEFLPLQPGDVPCTSSDNSKLENWINYKPNTTIKDGVSKFVSWYRKFYKV